MSAIRIGGYVAFFMVSFLLSFYLTFPWDAAKDRLLDFASKQSGAQITAESLEPSWITGFTATKVKYKAPSAEAPLEIDELTARVKVLPLLTGSIGLSASMVARPPIEDPRNLRRSKFAMSARPSGDHE